MERKKNHVAISHWTHSAKGKPISLFHSLDLDLQKNQHPLLLIGGVHGDEPEGVYLAEAALDWVITQTSPAPRPWAIITCLNPDGRSLDERTNGNGVDLNRNYPAKNWSPTSDKPRYFPGPKPNSETEVQALVELIESTQPRAIIHCHSWKPCIVCSGPENFPAAVALSEASGFELVYDIGYPTPGSLSSFGWADRKIPVICIEDYEHKERKQVWPRFGAAIKKIFYEY